MVFILCCLLAVLGEHLYDLGKIEKTGLNWWVAIAFVSCILIIWLGMGLSNLSQGKPFFGPKVKSRRD